MEDFEIIGPQDQPALLAISTPDATDGAKTTLTGMGYKVHAAEYHEQFETALQPGQLIRLSSLRKHSRAEICWRTRPCAGCKTCP